MKGIKIGYYIVTALFSAFALFGPIAYFSDYENFTTTQFPALGFLGWIVLPLGIAKILGVAALWAPIPKMFREWAYAGFFFVFLLAMGAHIATEIPSPSGAIMGMVLLLASRFLLHKKESAA